MINSFIADVHIGNHKKFGGPINRGMNERCRYTLNALEEAVKRAPEGAPLHVCGDLFDTTSPTPQMIAYAGRVLLKRGTDATDNVRVIAGNHEMVSSSSGDHSVVPIDLAGNVQLLESPMWVRGGVFMIPHHREPTKGMLKRVMKNAAKTCSMIDRPNILALHVGLDDGSLPYSGQGTSVDVEWLAKFAKKHNFTHVISGDWHTHASWEIDGVHLIQVGALCPTGFSNPGLGGYGSIVSVHEDGKWTLDCVPGPRFLKPGPEEVTRDRVVDWVSSSLVEHLFLQVKCESSAEYEAVLSVKNDVSDLPVTIEAALGQAALRGSAKEAAKMVNDAADLSSAVEAYCQSSVPDGLREKVVSKVNHYLEASRARQ